MRALILLGLWLSPPSYEDACVALEDGVKTARNGDAAQAVRELTAALDGVTHFPVELAADDKMLEQRDNALLALAFSYNAIEDKQHAIEAMDEAIRTARTRQLPVQIFGPAIAGLYEQRVAALSALGQSTIVVNCSDCRVLINELPSQPNSEPLFLGSYRVWVSSGEQVTSQIVELDGADQQVEVSLPVPAPTVAPTPRTTNDAPIETPKLEAPDSVHRERVLPRWASITGAAVGAAVGIAGGVVLAFNGRCPGGQDAVTESDKCPSVYDAIPVGAPLVAGGAAILTGFGVVLTLDEVRSQRRQNREVSVHYTFRF